MRISKNNRCMKTRTAFPALLSSMLAFAAVARAQIKHDFVAIDEGITQLLRVNENDPSKNWIVKVAPAAPAGVTRSPRFNAAPRDMQLVGNNRILISHDAGFSEFDLATGKVVKEINAYKGIATARRLPNGDTLIAGVNLDGSTGVVVLEIDDANTIKNKTVFPGDYVRLIRETAQGTWLIMNNTMIREGDRTGKILHEWPVAGFQHAWKALRLPNGHILSSAGYGAFFVELDADGKELRRFAQKETMPKEMHANFYAMFQLLPNGHIVVANWQNHGAGHGTEGIQMVEFDPAEPTKLLWQWSEAPIISSLQGVLVLDGLDTSKLHDERTGVMAPLAAAK
jgi:hypothetical protein